MHAPIYRAPVPRVRRRIRLRLGLLLATLAVFALIGAAIGNGLAAGPAGEAQRAAMPDRSAERQALITEWGTLPTVPPPSPTVPVAIATPAAPPPAQTAVAASSPAAPGATAPPFDRGQLDRVMTTLQTGQFDMVIAYANGTSVTEHLSFDLGQPGQESRWQSSTRYRGITGIRANEQLVAGTRSWARQADGPWAPAPVPVDLRARIGTLLPALSGTDEPTITAVGGLATLRWYDPARATDIELQVDIATGTPKRLRERERTSGTERTVTYTAWNGAVAITPPGVQ